MGKFARGFVVEGSIAGCLDCEAVESKGERVGMNKRADKEDVDAIDSRFHACFQGFFRDESN